MTFADAPADESVVWWHRATVTRIVDGDTIDVVLDRSFKDFGERRIRFAFIDCPDADRVAKDAATAFLRTMLTEGDEVLLYSHKSETGVYGRIVADVICNGVNLCRAILDAGHAVPYVK